MAARVLYLHGTTMIGGAETDLLGLISGLNRQEFHPFVACPQEGPLVEELQSLQVAIYSLKLPAWRKFKDIGRIPIAVANVVRLIHQNQIDLVHVNDYWWSPIAWLASRFTRRPCVVHIRQPLKPVRVKQYWLNKADRLIAVSQVIRTVAIEAGVEPDQIMVAYSGIDIPEGFEKNAHIISRLGLDSSQPIIGTVANLLPHKGYEYLIQAFGEVKQTFPHCRLLIVGEGSKGYRSKLMRLIESLGLEQSVTLVGFQRRVFEYISTFDIFVLPSVYEAFGIVLLEAMAMGKAVVASRVGGIPEIVVDGISGLLVPPCDSSALAFALRRLLQDEDARLAMGRAGRERVERYFTRDGMVKVIQDIYAGLLAANTKVAGP